MFLLVSSHPGSPGQRAVKQLLYSASLLLFAVGVCTDSVASVHQLN